MPSFGTPCNQLQIIENESSIINQRKLCDSADHSNTRPRRAFSVAAPSESGADPEEGARVPPRKKWGHTICPEPMSFLEGVEVPWSLEKVKTKISKLYIIRTKNITT